MFKNNKINIIEDVVDDLIIYILTEKLLKSTS